MNNKIKYITGYNKEHYKQLKVYLTPEEMSELESQLTRLKLSKVQFVRNAIKELKKK